MCCKGGQSARGAAAPLQELVPPLQQTQRWAGPAPPRVAELRVAPLLGRLGRRNEVCAAHCTQQSRCDTCSGNLAPFPALCVNVLCSRRTAPLATSSRAISAETCPSAVLLMCRVGALTPCPLDTVAAQRALQLAARQTHGCR